MTIDYIVVQAGGKGTRLEHLTANKPKALVPVKNLPMLFHLFRKFPDKRFIVIADYKKEVLREYLECFAEVKYCVVDASGGGTCGGVKQAVSLVPEDTPFMLIWSDLILPENFELPHGDKNYVGISETFPCRWSYQNGAFAEKASAERGVAGLFVFKDAGCLAGIPESGELVRYLSARGEEISEIGLAGTKEFGLLSEYEQLPKEKCRPFNRIRAEGGILVKEGIDDQGKKLARLESNWYNFASANNVTAIPRIYGTDPIRMECIQGKNIYEYPDLTCESKVKILEKLVAALQSLHEIKNVPADVFSLREAYYTKTVARLQKVRDLIPFADRETITVNDRKCRNVFFHKRELEKRLEGLPYESFAFIHGDCTFSNMMLRNDSEPVLIDPRGYFGFTELFGDPLYDWAKLYYSLAGNYDRFNLKDFQLSIASDSVRLAINSNCWEDLERDFFKLSGADEQAIKLIHAVIWLSLTTYAWQDYDSICGAFYNGLYYLEEIL
jgi:GTP:adenosylcobinamide-phosphate guanylyltransferase/thiamine kinase-like enzyme